MKKQPQKIPARANNSSKAPQPCADVDIITPRPVEVGGHKGPEPTRYGDWENAGRCTDF